MCACAGGGNLVSKYNQKIGKGEFFKLVRVRFEKQVSEVRKKGKTNVWSLDLDKKMENYFFLQKVHAPAIADNFFF